MTFKSERLRKAVLQHDHAVQADPDLERRGRALYSHHTDNHPQIHCNRFPAWEELPVHERIKWCQQAQAADQKSLQP